MVRMAFGLFVAMAVVVGLSAQAQAEEKTHEGRVVSATGDTLVMTDKDGKNEHRHSQVSAAKVTLDGKTAKLGDLKKGDMVRVVTDTAGKVTSITATRTPG
jgi:hypothetical protein